MSLYKYIRSLRKFRVLHRFVGTGLAILLLISAVTGIFLALKKEFDILQPPTQKGEVFDMKQWKSMDELAQIATSAFHKQYPEQKDNKIDRMDVRPSKAVVKVLFKSGYWEVQIDPYSGEVKSILKRHSDWIEALHDGSIISDLFKLITMNVLGIGVLFLIFSGLWLWYGPKLFRKVKRSKRL